MCRHVAYTGPAIAASDVLTGTEHGMEHQSYAARELLVGTVCGDGYGVGWYADEIGATPARYAYPGPIWSDTNLHSMMPTVRSPMIMAAVRNATVAGHNTQPNCAPFLDGPHLMSLNGFLGDFDDFWKDDHLRDRIAPARRKRIGGNTDAEYLFQAILTATDDISDDMALIQATQAVLRDLIDIGAQHGKEVHLNLLLSDGERIVATRASNRERSNSLYTLQDGQDFPGGWLVASEPIYDDAEWQPVDDATLVILQEGCPAVRLKI